MSPWHCSRCKTSFSGTVGTLFHKTQVDLQRWFCLIHMARTDERLNAAQAARDLAMRLPTVWAMLKKLRQASPADRELVARL